MKVFYVLDIHEKRWVDLDVLLLTELIERLHRLELLVEILLFFFNILKCVHLTPVKVGAKPAPRRC